MPVTNSDAVLWYNVEEFGVAGYAVPNWSDDVGTLNPTIAELVSLSGINLFSIMHHEDADLTTPPSVNTLKRVHKLYLRLASILAGRSIPPGQNNMETDHVRPAGEIFLVYPSPYFNVRNRFMKQWSGWVMMMISEMMQHTENRKEIEISTNFAGDVGQYMKRVYTNMAIELFQKDKAVAEADGFMLTDADFAAYNPALFFTSVEMTDTVPRLDRVFTEDRLAVLRQGIPITQLPATVQPWPVNLVDAYSKFRSDATIVAAGKAGQASGGSSSGGSNAPVIPPPIGP